jgi:hypothetical protein
MDDLYTRQSRAQDPDERRKLLRAFEKRLYDDESLHPLPSSGSASCRILPRCGVDHHAQTTTSTSRLDTVWLAE